MLKNFLTYLQYELNRAPLTVEAYSLDLTQFFEWLDPKNPGEIDYGSVTSSDIRAWLGSLARKGENHRTLRRKIISLRSFFKWLLRKGKIEVSPLEEISLPKIPKPLPDFIRQDEIETALRNLEEAYKDNEENVEAFRNYLIVDMLYSLGIRRAELIALMDSDVSIGKGEIKVTGKRSKQRVVPIPGALALKIQKWQMLRDKEQDTLTKDSPLFMIKGKRITPNQVYKIVHEALSGSTARKKSPHALRHSFASGMLNGGAELDTVREFLGHSSLSTTQIYTHISLNEIKKAYSSAHPRSTGKKE